MKILVIDDDDVLREVLVGGLRAMSGYQVSTANDGESGLRAIEETRPDVILLDLAMPGLDGFAVLERLRSGSIRHRPQQVIVVSALTDRETMARLRELRVDAILPKPFLLSELRALLEGSGSQPEG